MAEDEVGWGWMAKGSPKPPWRDGNALYLNRDSSTLTVHMLKCIKLYTQDACLLLYGNYTSKELTSRNGLWWQTDLGVS